MMTSSAEWSYEIQLPEGLFTHILLRMPVKSVVRYRCLSKWYRELIDSPDFIRKHYELSVKTRPTIILPRRHENDGIHRGNILVEMDLAMSVVKFTVAPPDTGFVGFCRGILCYKLDNIFDFWNPYTGVHRKSSPDPGPITSNYYFYLLGYDAVADDVKVLKIVQYSGDGEEASYVCSIYSSNTDSWRETKGFTSNQFRLESDYMRSGVFVEGTNRSHVFASQEVHGARSKVILAFDFAAEELSYIRLPRYRGFFDGFLCLDLLAQLSSLDGCLCFYHKVIFTNSLDVWVMKEYGVEQSWTRVFTVVERSVRQDITYLNHAGVEEWAVFDGIQMRSSQELKELEGEELKGEFSILPQDSNTNLLHLDPQSFVSTPTHRKP